MSEKIRITEIASRYEEITELLLSGNNVILSVENRSYNPQEMFEIIQHVQVIDEDVTFKASNDYKIHGECITGNMTIEWNNQKITY